MEAEEPGRPAIVATKMATPWGPVHLAATRRGIAAVALLTPAETFADGLERRLGAVITWVRLTGPGSGGEVREAPAMRHLRAAAAALEAAPGGGAAAAAAAVPLDLADRPAWDRAVLEAVRAIPTGEVRSYGDIARAIGRPGAARAVGGAVGRNPVAMLVPCHRVVAGDGTLGGYGGGWWGDHERLLELKAGLLAREGVTLPRSRPRRQAGR